MLFYGRFANHPCGAARKLAIPHQAFLPVGNGIDNLASPCTIFPAGRNFAGISSASGHTRARLVSGELCPGGIAQGGKVSGARGWGRRQIERQRLIPLSRVPYGLSHRDPGETLYPPRWMARSTESTEKAGYAEPRCGCKERGELSFCPHKRALT